MKILASVAQEKELKELIAKEKFKPLDLLDLPKITRFSLT